MQGPREIFAGTVFGPLDSWWGFGWWGVWKQHEATFSGGLKCRWMRSIHLCRVSSHALPCTSRTETGVLGSLHPACRHDFLRSWSPRLPSWPAPSAAETPTAPWRVAGSRVSGVEWNQKPRWMAVCRSRGRWAESEEFVPKPFYLKRGATQ